VDFVQNRDDEKGRAEATPEIAATADDDDEDGGDDFREGENRRIEKQAVVRVHRAGDSGECGGEDETPDFCDEDVFAGGGGGKFVVADGAEDSSERGVKNPVQSEEGEGGDREIEDENGEFGVEFCVEDFGVFDAADAEGTAG